MTNEVVNQEMSQAMTSLTSNVPKMAKYMRFIGILQIIGGAIYCLTIIGALIGVPVIYMGIRLREAAESFEKYLTSDSKQDLELAVFKQTKSFYIQYVLTIITLVLLALYIIILVGFLAAM
jgi:hypothetical protein